MTKGSPTMIGIVDSVKGGVITIRLREDVPTFIMVEGRSYRVGQIGAFLRIPLGYTQLYAVCTLVGAAAAPEHQNALNSAGSSLAFCNVIWGIYRRSIRTWRKSISYYRG